MNYVFILLLGLMVCCFLVPNVGNEKKDIVLQKDAKDYTLRAVQGGVVVEKGIEPVYVIDNTDVQYYTDKRKHVITRYNNELRERGLRPNVVVQELAHEPLEDYILNELVGNNLRNEEQVLGGVLGNGGLPRPDTQSVHDTNVQGTLRVVYDGVKEVSREPNRVFSESSVLRLAEEIGVDTSKVHRVLTTMKNRRSTVMNYVGDQEYDVLKSTWKAGNDNVREQIVRNLVDCVEESPLGTNVVCPTGVASRIVESALIDTPELMPKTRETLVQEMLSKANAVRTNLEKDKEYNDLSDNEQTRVLKEFLMQTYVQDYQGILDIEQINEYVKDWIDEI